MLRSNRERRGFTLVELLVSLAVLIALGALALLVVPDVLDQDRTTDGASLTRQWLMIAKARAARDGLPRGVRLIVSADPNNPSKTDNRWVTEMQYIESPPVLLGTPTPNAPTMSGGVTGAGTTAGPPGAQPTIRFDYPVTNGVLNLPPTYPAGPPNGQQCYILNGGAATTQIQSDIATGRRPTLFLPTVLDSLNGNGVGFWCHITSITVATGEIRLDRYPNLGAATRLDINHFGIYGAPQPQIGEPTQQLPKEICIDLASSQPAGSNTQDYDILFAPNGQIAPAFGTQGNVGQINLWVRNYTKPGGNPSAYSAPLGNFQLGGEQQVVALKTKSGSLGVFPVAWTGNPFQLAQQGATGYGN